MQPLKVTDDFVQDWDDDEFCKSYEQLWEISNDEVHYGWLSPGENELRLLQGLNKKNINVLDMGCGLGQNLIALAKEGATCFGVDISPCMLQKAENKVINEGLNTKVTLEQGDMRSLDCFPGIQFDLILSIYSMEYLSNLQEFRKVIANVYRRLKDGGTFIMCFSHHSQAQENRYPELINCSVPVGTGKYRPYNYSYRDAVDALIKAKFTIENIIEQKTSNPSQISYERGKQYPYHYREGQNPCKNEFDEISNANPHTVIFKISKQYNNLRGIPTQGCLDLGFREVWGYRRSICNIKKLDYLGLTFNAITLAPMDNVIGLVDVLSFKVAEEEIYESNKSIEIYTQNNDGKMNIPGNSILGIIHRKLMAYALEPQYQQYLVEKPGDEGVEQRALINSIVGLDDIVKSAYLTNKVGLLVFINGDEPMKGEMPLDFLNVVAGDEVKLTYVCLMENKKKNENQLDLGFTE